ncbi:hypothetical protein MUP05_03540 [Candidatus Bathyarchaeota archaeon]|nr:hypothetical protein [Candidatus Bathyarchaeota archaeon]
MSKPYTATKNEYDTFRKDAEAIIRAFDEGKYRAEASRIAQSSKREWLAAPDGGLEEYAFVLAVMRIHSLDFPKKIVALAEEKGLKHLNKFGEDGIQVWHDLRQKKIFEVVLTHLILDGADITMILPPFNKPSPPQIPLLNITSDKARKRIGVVSWLKISASLESLAYFLKERKS